MKKLVKFLPGIPALLAFVLCLLPYGFAVMLKAGPEAEEVTKLYSYLDPVLIPSAGIVSAFVCGIGTICTFFVALIRALKGKTEYGVVGGLYALSAVCSLNALGDSAVKTAVGGVISALLVIGVVLCFAMNLYEKIHE